MRKALTAVVVALVLVPLLWLAYSAFLPREALYSGQPLTLRLSFENFRNLAPLGLERPLVVSLLASSAVVLLQLMIALPAAYALRSGARMLGLFLLALAIPAELLLVPLYGLLQSLKLLATPWALVLPFAASPFAVFLLYQGLLRQPWAYVEAARIDGAGELTIMTRIMAPLLRAELAAAGVLAFAAHWNLVLYPRVVAPETYPTVQVALANLLRSSGNDWGLLGAAALVTSLPIVLLYFAFEKQISKTFQGGIK
nr:carbohydrate ABC transporter permease [Deinobacterium chartae]